MSDLREMLITSPSWDLRNIHRDVWRKACQPVDGTEGRSFLFALAGGGRVLVRGPHLAPTHSQPVEALQVDAVYRFVIDARTVSRSKVTHKENLVPQERVGGWLADRLPGFSLIDARASLPQRRAFEDGRTLPYRTVTGLVRVTDIRPAEGVLERGVGRGKAFGFGMLVLLERLAAHGTVRVA